MVLGFHLSPCPGPVHAGEVGWLLRDAGKEGWSSALLWADKRPSRPVHMSLAPAVPGGTAGWAPGEKNTYSADVT